MSLYITKPICNEKFLKNCLSTFKTKFMPRRASHDFHLPAVAIGRETGFVVRNDGSRPRDSGGSNKHSHSCVCVCVFFLSASEQHAAMNRSTFLSVIWRFRCFKRREIVSGIWVGSLPMSFSAWPGRSPASTPREGWSDLVGWRFSADAECPWERTEEGGEEAGR